MEVGDEGVALASRESAVQEGNRLEIESILENGNEEIAHFFELRKDESAFVVFDDRFEHVDEPQNLARTIGRFRRCLLE